MLSVYGKDTVLCSLCAFCKLNRLITHRRHIFYMHKVHALCLL